MSGENSFHYALSFAVVGMDGCGKRRLINSFISNAEVGSVSAEDDKGVSEPGIHFDEKVVSALGRVYRLEYMRVSGPSALEDYSARLVSASSALIVVYDVSNPNSFQVARRWVARMNSLIPFSVPSLLLCNKIDLPKSEHMVPTSEGKAFALKHDMLYFEVSAVTHEAVFEAFTRVQTTLFSHLPLRNPDIGLLVARGIHAGENVGVSEELRMRAASYIPGCTANIDELF